MRTSDDYANALIFGIPLAPNPDIEVPLPKGFYICMDCHEISNYWEPGMVCATCELRGEQQQEEDR